MADFAQLAKDVQALLLDVAGCQVFEGEPPRDATEALAAEPPFLVYSANMRSPQTEFEEYQIDLLLDVWALGGWSGCYEVAERLHEALHGTTYDVASGVVCCDPNGQVMSRAERDPDDERIRRMSGQYLIRYNPNE